MSTRSDADPLAELLERAERIERGETVPGGLPIPL